MKLALFAYSRQGCATGRKVLTCFACAEKRAYTMERFQETDFLSLQQPAHPFYGELFHWADVLIFIGACGIAVREIAPHLQDKRTDPAVICLDELGQYVIPLLSGHIGGANALAKQIARALHAVPVITTATDIQHKFSVDAWATENGFILDDISLAKAVSAAILEKDIPLACDFPIVSLYPKGVTPGNAGEIGIYIGYKRQTPFTKTLRLLPRVLHLGIGCRKGTDVDIIRLAVETVLRENHLDERAVKCVASIDLKQGEPGLCAVCKEKAWKTHFYRAEELQAVPGNFTPSPFVESITGVDNVCERAALLGADTLLVRKTVFNGVTIAIAVENLEVSFG